jgi:hypothetical protein
MQIVIDISEDNYKLIQDRNYYGILSHEIYNAIENGIPLPKGHGRIADMDETIKCIKEVEGDDAIWAISLIEWACGKRTIIEADKAEK